MVTLLSLGLLNRTDIPQDFEITGMRQIVVPPGAEYLFVSPLDNFFSENLSADLRVYLEVVDPAI